MSSTPAIEINSQAPNFTLKSQHGTPVSLHDYIGKNWVILFFYPKDDSSVCTRQACGFRDAYAEFEKAGAVVIGISSDDADSHKDFAIKHRLPFLLLSDPGGGVRKLYRVPSLLGLIPGRTTFVIDKNSVIRDIFTSHFSAEAHIQRTLKTLSANNVAPKFHQNPL